MTRAMPFCSSTAKCSLKILKCKHALDCMTGSEVVLLILELAILLPDGMCLCIISH